MEHFEDAAKSLQDRLGFIGLDAGALDRLNIVQTYVDRHLPRAIELFYEKIAKVPRVSKFFSGSDQMKRAGDSQIQHWKKIAAGRFDLDYVEATNRIGLRHAKIGLEPRWYVGGYGVIVETLVKGVVHDFMSDRLKPGKRRFGRHKVDAGTVLAESDELAACLAEIVKAVMVDIDYAVSTYFDKLTQDAAEESKRNADKVMLAVTEVGHVLKRLTEGDLTERVEAELDPSLQKLKEDANAVADRLEDIVTQLRGTSRSLKSATSEILAGANDLSMRTTKQAAAIEQTSAAMEQLATTVAENATRAGAARAQALVVSGAAEAGGKVMHDANDAMERITASSSKISNIIGLIDDIAFQTNLLALNASVEAARAGDAGKGFAVVAIEVRRLAQSAAAASSEVKSLIEQSANEVKAGTMLVSAAAGKLEDMLSSIRESAETINEIAHSSQAQSMAIAEVSTAVREMDEMTQHNAALVEETNAAIEQTEGQASELDQLIALFVLRTGQATAVPMKDDPKDRRSNVRRAAATYLTSGNTALKDDWTEF